MNQYKYTSDVEKVLEKAQEFAVRLQKNLATEHILASIVTVENTYAYDILKQLKVDKETIYHSISELNTDSLNPVLVRDQVRRAMSVALTFAERSGYDLFDTQHLLLGLTIDKSCGAAKILQKFNIGTAEIKPIVESMTANGIGMNDKQSDDEFSDIMGLIKSFFETGFESNKSTPIFKVDLRTAPNGKIELNQKPPKGEKKEKNSDSQEISEELKAFGIDMTANARAGKYDPVIGRDKEIEQVLRVLSRRTKNNPLIIGEPGVGKTAIVEGLAQAIAEGKVPSIIKDKRIFALDVGSLVAGTKFRGEFEERFKNMLKELEDDKTILFIDEMHMIMSVGDNDGGATIANLLKPLLARGDIPTIGATTIDEYRKHIEKDAALERRFKPIMVDPPSVEDTIKILEGIRDKYQSHHKVQITDNALIAAATLSDRYVADRYLPDKAIDAIDEAASKMRVSAMVTPTELVELENKRTILNDSIIQATKAEDFVKANELKAERDQIDAQIKDQKVKWGQDITSGQLSIDEAQIAEIISEWTSIPISNLTEEESTKLLALESDIKKRVIGQDEAVSAVARAIKRARAGLKDPKKPIGTFMFLGPTGVGKTELTKALAESMFGDENMLIRIDMSEYMEKINVSRLIGSAPGYVGYDEGGQLTEKVRRKPYSVVLFDEIEKAHPDVFNLLLQILDEGRLTDSHGRVVSFKNTVIIMTSNIGAKDIAKMKRVGFGQSFDVSNDYEAMKEKQLSALKDAMNPEFINRIDDIIIFRKLDKESLEKIAGIMIGNVVNILEEKGIKLTYTQAVLDYLLEKGTDLEYGARPLKRAVQKIFEDKLSEEIISGNITNESDVTVDIVDGDIVFNKN